MMPAIPEFQNFPPTAAHLKSMVHPIKIPNAEVQSRNCRSMRRGMDRFLMPVFHQFDPMGREVDPVGHRPLILLVAPRLQHLREADLWPASPMEQSGSGNRRRRHRRAATGLKAEIAVDRRIFRRRIADQIYSAIPAQSAPRGEHRRGISAKVTEREAMTVCEGTESKGVGFPN